MSIQAISSIQSTNNSRSQTIIIDGHSLSFKDIQKLQACDLQITPANSLTSEFFMRSVNTLDELLADGRRIYGVNTLFGGMANVAATDVDELQTQLINSHNAGMGNPLPAGDVRLAMLIRANTLCHGVSAVRKELVDRYLMLSQMNITPLVCEYGSIGASGDLIPLSSIAGAVLGLSNDFQLNINGEFMGAKDALKKLGLPSIAPRQKEGLALINGTSMLTAIAANNCIAMATLFNYHLQLQGVMCEVMQCDTSAFASFIHQHRPHPGQRWIAKQLNDMLLESKITRAKHHVEQDFSHNHLIQDRYSIRCMPQFLGPIVEDLCAINRTIEIEMNSATDNPLIDTDNRQFFHGGNFLGQHVAMAMDKMRVSLALLAKHNEAQIATLVEPNFSRDLPASLVAASDRGRSVGCKPLQILGNSIAPLIEQNANPLTVHFPVYAEQFNQNLNSQGFGAAQLTSRSLELFEQHLACFSLILLQAAQLRSLQLQRDLSQTYSPAALKWIDKLSQTLGLERSQLPICTDNAGQYRHMLSLIGKKIRSDLSQTVNSIYTTNTDINNA